MPRIIFVKQNGGKIYIDCKQVPLPGGGAGTLEIPNVEIREKLNPDGTKDFDYLWFPKGFEGEIQPEDLVLNLKGELIENSMILPYDGGHVPAEPPDSQTELTVKLRK